MLPKYENPWMKLSDPHPVDSFVNKIIKDSDDCDLCMFVYRTVCSYIDFCYVLERFAKNKFLNAQKIIYSVVDTPATLKRSIKPYIFKLFTCLEVVQLLFHTMECSC